MSSADASRPQPPTPKQVQKLRLLLSTFQDGTGQQAAGYQPGWRDFERSAAVAFGGEAKENKFAFDVLVPYRNGAGVRYGISCKMRGTLNDTRKNNRVTLELTNSAGDFWAALEKASLSQDTYRSDPTMVGQIIVDVVNQRYTAVSTGNGGQIDLAHSFYFALSWNKAGWFQLHQFSLALPDPQDLLWSFPQRKANKRDKGFTPGTSVMSRALRGVDKDTGHTVLEWYGQSGGQLKYYPLTITALWQSKEFRLEPLPQSGFEYGLSSKAATYFPMLWTEAYQEDDTK